MKNEDNIINKDINTLAFDDNIDSIIRFIQIAKKNIILLIFIPFLFVIIGLITLYYTPNTYKSMGSFFPPPTDMILDYSDDISSLSLSGSPVNIGKGFTSFFKNPSQVYVEILKSRYIKEYIIKKYDLQNKFKDKYIEDTLMKMDKLITIKENNGIIEVYAETKEPKLSSEIVKSSINKLSELLDKLTAKKTTKFLEKRLNEIHTSLINSSTNLKNFQLDNKMVDVQKQSEGIINSITTLQTQIILAESELDSLKEVYTENSVKIKTVKAKIDNLKEQLTKIQKVNSNPSSKQFPTDLKLLDMPTLGLNYTTLYRDNLILEQIYILLTKQYELAKIKESKENLELKIIDKPSIPTKKSGPKKTLIMIFVLLLGFLTSFIILVYKFIIYNFYTNFPDKYNTLKGVLSFRN
ncbi:MAG: GNVR domain-containing protein [Candidatus Sericytochromatia bacterium]